MTFMSSNICDCEFPTKVGRKKRSIQDGKRYIDPLYFIWLGILHRCSSETYKNKSYYSGRGIGVCSRWQDDFYYFKQDIGERPSELHSIDRIENNKGYCPHNVKWATKLEQSHNTRKHRIGSSRILPGIKVNKNGTLSLRIKIKNVQKDFLGFTSLYEAYLFRMKVYREAYGIEDHNYLEAIKFNIHRIKEHSEEDYLQFSRHI